MNAKVLRLATLLPMLLALVTLFQPILPDHAHLAQFFTVVSSASFGIALLLLATTWFLYISGYRYARQIMFWAGAIPLAIILWVLAGYFINHAIPLEHQLIPLGHRPFLLNLSLMLFACYLIQVLSYWLPRTKVLVNVCLAGIFLMLLLSLFGHLYNIAGLREATLLLPMPFGTLVYFVVLSLTIFAYVNHMHRLYLSSGIVIGFAAMFIAVLGANLIVYNNINKTVNVLYKGGSTQEILVETYNVDLYLDNAESTVEAFETSGNPQYITTFHMEQQAYLQTLASLRSKPIARLGTMSSNQSISSITTLGNNMFAAGGIIMSQENPAAISEATRTSVNESMYGYMAQVQKGIKAIDQAYAGQLYGLAGQESSDARDVILGLSITSSLSLLFIIFTPLFIRETIQKLSITQSSLRKSNRLLYEEKSRAEAVLASISDGLFAVDTNKVITIFNEAAEDMTGLHRATVLGKRYDEITQFRSVADRDKTLDFTEKALEGNTNHLTHGVVLWRPNGQKLDVQVSASPVKSSSGEVMGAIIVFRDRSNEQALENAKDEFVSLASHQLRTPATATKQFLAMFLQGYAGHIDARQRLFLQEAYDNNEMGIKFIEDLLNITRLENNKLKVVKERIEVATLLREAIKRHETVAGRDRQVIRLIAPEKPIYLETEVNLLGMVLDNLLSNALKYSNEGGAVTVRLSDGGHVKIAVSDEGIGIKKEDIPKLFERFSRLEDPQKQYVSGTGIGLYLVKKIARRLHATIHVESEYGKGSTFTLILRSQE